MGFGELLRQLRSAADQGFDFREIEDEIEYLAEFEAETSRAEALAFTGDASMRVWALGLIGDARDLPIMVAALDDPALRHTALEAVGGQRDREPIDGIARAFLDDPDPGVRRQAASLVAWLRRPGYAEALLPLTRDTDQDVRSVITLRLAMHGDATAAPLLRIMLDDPVERIRRNAQRGLDRLSRPT
ncbi:HEAT repeat domain-containing protein [Actinoplanes sp. NPDC026670]|uniref:HEAT repeat domain-containing protein n=1 Tax=Actinoplanes sp. NPDC026670 TaxID=3154700 RepID=UPI0033FD48C3